MGAGSATLIRENLATNKNYWVEIIIFGATYYLSAASKPEMARISMVDLPYLAAIISLVMEATYLTLQLLFLWRVKKAFQLY